MVDQYLKAMQRAEARAGGVVALARALSVTHQAVSQWKRGASRPSLANAIQMADLYGINPAHFRPPEEARLIKSLRGRR